MLNVSHKQQRDEAIIRSLNRAGIRPRYHRMTISDLNHPLSPRLKEWVDVTSHQEPHRGLTLIGGNDMEDLTVAVARGLHLTGRAVYVTGVVGFYELVMDRERREDILSKVQTLVVRGYANVHAAGEGEAFSRKDLLWMERVLTDWLEDGDRLILHAASADFSGWLSPGFMDRLGRVNTVYGGEDYQ